MKLGKIVLAVTAGISQSCAGTAGGPQGQAAAPQSSGPAYCQWKYAVDGESTLAADGKTVLFRLKARKNQVCDDYPNGYRTTADQPAASEEFTLANVQPVMDGGPMTAHTVLSDKTDANGGFETRVDVDAYATEWATPMTMRFGGNVEAAWSESFTASARRTHETVVVQKQQAKAAQEELEIQQRSDAETKAAKCSDNRVASLQQLLQGLKPVIESDRLVLDTQEIDVATASGTKLKLSTPLGGEYHIILAGYSKISIDVTNAKGQAVAAASPYASIVSGNGGWSAPSRTMQANRGDKFTVTVKGTGCFLMMSYQRY